MTIPLMKPWLGAQEATAAAKAVESGWVAQGPRVADIEAAFARSVGAAHGVALSSCTGAAPGAAPAWDRRRRPGRRAVVVVHRHGQRGALRRRRAGVR